MRLRHFATLFVFLFTTALVATPAKDDPFHPNDPVLRSEHAALLDLVKPDDATDLAANDGPWSAPTTWKSNHLPAADARVLIPAGIAVTLDSARIESLHWLRVD